MLKQSSFFLRHCSFERQVRNTHSRMFFFKLLALTLAGLAAAVPTDKAAPPQFSSEYQATGWVILPYAEIYESFTAWYSKDAKKSRIDYYGDLMQTVQRGDTNQNYKIAYAPDNSGNAIRNCFQQAGTADAPVETQDIFPDLTGFKLVYSGPCAKTNNMRATGFGDDICEAWFSENTVEEKTNEYLFYLRRDAQGYAIPIVYIMTGYDSLLGSHFDKYEVVYQTYTPGPVDKSVYDIVNEYKCHGYPGPGLKSKIAMNPMHEFVHGRHEHIDAEFDNFKGVHGKEYDTKEHAHRAMVFRSNYRMIESHNRRLKTYKLAVNHLADRTDDELKYLRGRKSTGGKSNAVPFDKSQYSVKDVPQTWDWRIMGAVTPVKDQAVCGSCWSFGTTGTLEGVNFVKTGKLISLSEQQLMDCSWNQGDNACDGGEDFRAYEYIISSGGIATEQGYGAYLGADGKCHDKNVPKAFGIAGYCNVTSGDQDALLTAIYNVGPVTVAIDASQKTFAFYSHGVYNDEKCSSTELDHQVLAVGFGELKGQKYWLVKNSWSNHWGNDGYVLIARDNNICGVSTSPSFPLL